MIHMFICQDSYTMGERYGHYHVDTTLYLKELDQATKYVQFPSRVIKETKGSSPVVG